MRETRHQRERECAWGPNEEVGRREGRDLVQVYASALRMNSLALSDTLGTSLPSGKVTDVDLMIVW